MGNKNVITAIGKNICHTNIREKIPQTFKIYTFHTYILYIYFSDKFTVYIYIYFIHREISSYNQTFSLKSQLPE